MTKGIFFALLFSVLCFNLQPPQVAEAQDAIGITVAPITDEFDALPGATLLRTITVINPGSDVITLYPVALDFTTDNENGQPTFFASNDESRSYTLSQWMQFGREFIRVAANEEERFDVVIQVPENAEPGGHYGAILFSTEEPKLADDDDTKVSVVGMVGTLLLATVPGDIVERLELEQFSVPKIVFGSPTKLDLLFKNTGNVHVKPRGEIVVRNWSGNQTTVLNVNEGNGNVLPESRRKFSQNWSFTLGNFGIYRATAQLTYGTTPQELIATRQIIILPYWLMLAAIIIILSAIYGIVKFRRRRAIKKPVSPVLR